MIDQARSYACNTFALLMIEAAGILCAKSALCVRGCSDAMIEDERHREELEEREIFAESAND